MASAFSEAGFVLRKAMPRYRLVGWLVGCSFHWEKAAIWDTVGGLLEGAFSDRSQSQTLPQHRWTQVIATLPTSLHWGRVRGALGSTQ